MNKRMVGKSLNIKMYTVEKEEIHKMIIVTLADNIYYPIKAAFPKSGIDGLMACDKLTFCYDEETIICESKAGIVKLQGSDVYYLLYDGMLDNEIRSDKISYYKTRDLLDEYNKLYYTRRIKAAKKGKALIMHIPESGRIVKKEVRAENISVEADEIYQSIFNVLGAETDLILMIDSESSLVSELRNGWSYSLKLTEQDYKAVLSNLLEIKT